MQNPFVHLHVHTEYSLLDGINKVERLPKRAAALGSPAVAITDHGNVSGSYRFWKECKKQNVKPIIGMEAYYTIQDRTVREKDDYEQSYYHLILLALNNTGLHNLYKLSTFAYTEGMYRKPRIDDDLLSRYSEGIAATTACLGSRVSKLILNNDTPKAEKLIDHHRAIFNNRFLVELQLHADPEQQIINKELLKIANRKDIPIVLTNDCLTPNQYIMTEQGAKLVQDISKGDMVLTHKGRYRPVVVPVSREYSGKIYTFEIKQSKKKVTLTEEHPVYICDSDGNTFWKKAKDVLITDFVTFPRQKLSDSFIDVAFYMPDFVEFLDSTTVIKNKRHQKDRAVRYDHFPSRIEVDDDLAWLLGWFTAEGSTWEERSNNSSIRNGFNFALSSSEKDIAQKIVRIIKNKFNYEAKINYFDNWTEVRGNHICIAYLLSGLCGIGSKSKKIPNEIKTFKRPHVYLQALFEGNGTNTRTTQLATASISLAYDVKQLLASDGYWSNVSHIKRKCQTGYFDQYLISYTPNIIPSRMKWKCFEDFIARPLSKITVEEYAGPVYNFEVEEDNTYVTEFTVHNCHYQDEHDKFFHEAALCMQTKTTLSNPKRFTFGDIVVHVAEHDWMWDTARQQGIPYDAISNTVSVADMVDSDDYFTDRMNRYPKYQDLPEEYTSASYLELEAQHGLFERFGGIPPLNYRARLKEELDTIKRMGFSDYMLIVSQFMSGARTKGVLNGPGRGSAAGSLVAYSLKITEVDPIKYGLLFERFLNIGRGAKPLIFDKNQIDLINSQKLTTAHVHTCSNPNHSHGHNHITNHENYYEDDELPF